MVRHPLDDSHGGSVPGARRCPSGSRRRIPRPPRHHPPRRRPDPRPAKGPSLLLREPLDDPRRAPLPGHLHFIIRGRPWKIEKIGKDGMVYVTPVSDPNAMIPGWDGEMLPVPFGLAQRVGRIRKEIDARLAQDGVPKTIDHFAKAWPINKTGAKRLVEEHANHRKSGAPIPTDDRIVVEAFDRFLIVHASFGEVVNVTLGDLVEELLARKHLVRFWWTDPYRILYELVADTKELDV
ncbi:MAG: hypothetical protein E6K03_03650, partial [Methanobacteriota archaeon]